MLSRRKAIDFTAVEYPGYAAETAVKERSREYNRWFCSRGHVWPGLTWLLRLTQKISEYLGIKLGNAPYLIAGSHRAGAVTVGRIRYLTSPSADNASLPT